MRSLAALALLALVALPLVPRSTAATAPVSVNELDLWVRAGRTDGEILADVRQRGLLEPVGSDAERRLRADGASAALLSGLTAGSKEFVVSAEAAARARDEIAVQAEKDKSNRELALQRLRDTQPRPAPSTAPASAAPGTQPATTPGQKTPTLSLDAIAEPVGSGADGWRVGFVNACKQAAAEKKLVLVDFTGSDWCGWCKKLEREVFDTPQFKDYAAKKLVLVRADYPKRTPQPADVKAQNARLAEAFGVNSYPTIFVLNSAGKPVGKLGYQEGGPTKFIAELAKLEGR